MSFRRSTFLAIAAVGPNEADAGSDLLARLASQSRDTVLGALQEAAADPPLAAQLPDLGDAVAQRTEHHDPKVAAAAATCIGLLGPQGQKFEQKLVAMLNHQDVRCRAAAVEALGHMGAYVRDAAAVARAAQDPHALVRAQACEALAEMEATWLHEALAKLLHDAVPEVRCAAIRAIGTFVGSSLEMQSAYAARLGEVLEALLNNDRTRGAALDAISAMGGRAPASCAGAVLEALGDGDCGVRQSAVSAVGSMAAAIATNEACLESLKDLLRRGSAGARAAAAGALAALGPQAAGAAGPEVAALLADDREDASFMSLVMGGGGRRPPPQVRRPKCAALVALASLGDGAWAAEIAGALADANWEVRLCAAEALATLGAKARGEADALLGCLEDDAFPVRAAACLALGRLGDGTGLEGLPRLAEALEDPAPSVRRCALQAFGELATYGCLAAVEEHAHEVFLLTGDPAADVRAAAARALGLLGAGSRHYAGALAALLGDDDAAVRAAACEALSALGTAGLACCEELGELLGDSSPAVRQAALTALETLGYCTSPVLNDVGWSPGARNDTSPYWQSATLEPAGILLPGETCFSGLGSYYGDIVEKKQRLADSGKWIEGVI